MKKSKKIPSSAIRQQKFAEKLKAEGGSKLTVTLGRDATNALAQICHKSRKSKREAVESALLQAVIGITEIESDPLDIF